jgi:hypothetical protein
MAVKVLGGVTVLLAIVLLILWRTRRASPRPSLSDDQDIAEKSVVSCSNDTEKELPQMPYNP